MYTQRHSGLIVPLAFAEPAAKPELQEVATTANGRDITRGYVEGMPLLPTQDTVLQLRGGGDLKIYEEIARDDQVKAVFEQRRLAVVSKEWEVEPGDDSQRAEEAAEFLRAQLQRIHWDRVTDKMLWGIFFGYAVGECLWAVDAGQVVLEAIKVRRQKRFAFAPDSSLRLKTTAHPFGEDLPPRKFWQFSCGANNDDEPYGLGLAHWLYWPCFFKRNGIKFWLMFLEKFGQPTAKGTYPVNSQQEERNRLLAALSAIATDTGIIVPEGMQIDLLEAARSGTADYDTLCARMDAAISKVILGHSASSDATPGKLGSEDSAMEVRADIVKADADLICESFNRSVVVWLTEWNFGPEVAPPRVYRELRTAQDINTLSTGLQNLVGLGMRISQRWAHDTFMIPEAEEGEAVLTPPASPISQLPPDLGGAPEFAEPGERDIVATQADRLDVESEAAFAQLMAPVRRLVESAGSLEEIRDGLAALYQDMDEAAFAGVLQSALAAARLAGMDDIREGK